MSQKSGNRPSLFDLANDAAGLLVELPADQVGTDAPRVPRGDDAGRGEQAGEGEEASSSHDATSSRLPGSPRAAAIGKRDQATCPQLTQQSVPSRSQTSGTMKPAQRGQRGQRGAATALMAATWKAEHREKPGPRRDAPQRRGVIDGASPTRAEARRNAVSRGLFSDDNCVLSLAPLAVCGMR